MGTADMGVISARYQGRNEPLWADLVFQSCVLASLDAEGPTQEPTERARGRVRDTPEPWAPGREREDFIQGGVAPATWSPTVTSVLPVFNEALLSLQCCLIGFFTLVSLMAGGAEHLAMRLLAMLILSSSVKCLLKVFSSYPIGLLTV